MLEFETVNKLKFLKGRNDKYMETILKCENLCKTFGKREILKKVSLEIKQGDILGFIGPNGARKNNNDKINSRLAKHYQWKGNHQWI